MIDAADEDRAQVVAVAAGEPTGVGQQPEVPVDQPEEVDAPAHEDEQDQQADDDRGDGRGWKRTRIVRSRRRWRALPRRSSIVNVSGRSTVPPRESLPERGRGRSLRGEE